MRKTSRRLASAKGSVPLASASASMPPCASVKPFLVRSSSHLLALYDKEAKAVQTRLQLMSMGANPDLVFSRERIGPLTRVSDPSLSSGSSNGTQQ
jgi:hypothetical protein